MPELRHYRYFLEIARQGTFTAAAESLHMTQSALSEQVLQLERECGCLLFHRTRSGVKLTPAGEYLMPHAESLLQKAAETQDGLASFHLDVISPEDIRDVRLVTFPTGFTLRWIIDQWYRKAGYSPIVAAETGSLDVVLQLVAGGVGPGIVPRTLSWRGLAAGLRGVAFGPDEPLRRRVMAVRRTDDPRSELVRTLVSLMEAHAQNARRLAERSFADTAGELPPKG